jgi:hypothetical protein
MMFIKMPTATIKKLDKIFKDFLWGFKKEGGRKTPLVAWNKVVRQKHNGGLGLRRAITHSEALLSRWVLSALDEPDSEWARLFKANLQMVTWENGKHLRRQGYSMQDKILLGKIKSFRGMKYTSGLWKAWMNTRAHLSLQP